MKLFFASDIHGSVIATEKMLAAFEESGASHLVLLGDLLNHGPRNALPEGYDPMGVVALLNPLASRILAVRGNCDSDVDQMLFEFPMMADYHTVLLESGRRLFLTHGHLYNKDKHPALNEGDILVCGHTHIAVAEYRESFYCFNPGSVAIPRNDQETSYGILDRDVLKVISFEGHLIKQLSFS